MQEKETLGKVNFGKPMVPMERISATIEGMIKIKETRCMSLVEKFEEQLCESTGIKVEPRKEEQKASRSRKGENILKLDLNPNFGVNVEGAK